jgi:hypothetical protein
MPQSEAYSFDPGLIPNVDQEINELITKGSGEDSEGNLIPIIGSNGKYTEEYLTGTEITTTKRNKDGLAIRSTIRAADSAKIISTLTGSVLAKAQNYLKDYDAANSIWLEVFGPEVSKNKPLQRGEDGLGISIEDSRRFSEALLARAQSKLPSFNVETKEVDYFKTTSESIVNEVEKGKVPEIQITREKARNEILNLVNDPEDFLARMLGDDAYKIVETDKGKEVTILDVDVPVTYKLYDNASIERFFLREMGGADTKREDAKFMDQISYVLKTAKNNKDKSKEDTDKESKEAYNRYLKSK